MSHSEIARSSTTPSDSRPFSSGIACMSATHRTLSAVADITVIEYTIRRSPRARRVRVTVDATAAVEVVLPRGAPERAAASAVAELSPWIERRLREARRAKAAISARGATLPYLG